MTRSFEVLVAATDRKMLAYLERVLTAPDHSLALTDSFKQARGWIEAGTPDLLIADVRMGDFNGLQLGWVRRFSTPQLPSIITHLDHARSLAAEARKLGAPFVVVPGEERRLLNLVQDSLAAQAQRRADASRGLPEILLFNNRGREWSPRVLH